ncbi:hypothetical protein OK016_28680 [Vibrio chagasii]|nr:hypothetical protein [Vibrio chagasii]
MLRCSHSFCLTVPLFIIQERGKKNSQFLKYGSWKDISLNGEVVRQVTIPESIHSRRTLVDIKTR